MAKRRLFKVLSALVKVKPGEERVAVLIFAYFFLITAPFSIVKAVRNGSYLDNLSAGNLPYAYATAILIGLAVALQARLQTRLTRRGLLVSTLAFFLLTGLGFEALFEFSDWKWISLVYWFWANLFAVVLTTQFWIVVNDIFNPREAKRLIGFFGSGGILGGVVGGLLTGVLARPETGHRLLFLAGAFLLACLGCVLVLFARLRKDGERIASYRPAQVAAGPGAPEVGFRDCARTVRRSPYLKILAATVLTAGIVSTFVDWQSMNIIGRAPKISNLTSFFGYFNAGLLVFAFLFQLILTSRFIERFGLRAGLLVYPVLLLLGTACVAAWPFLIAAISLKGGDKALSYSIQQSSRELLYIPVPSAEKYKAKIFIDMFLNRFSKSIGGGVLLLLLLLPLPAGEPVIYAVCAVTGLALLAWMALNVRLSGAYVHEVRDNLAKKWERADGVLAGQADVGLAKLVVDTLESRRKSPELFALHLYEMAKSNRLTPEVRQLLSLAETDGGVSVGHPLLDGEERPWIPGFEVDIPSSDMTKEIEEVFGLDSYKTVMADYAGRLIDGEVDGGEVSRMELAKAIGLMGKTSPLAAKLEDLLLDASPSVFQFAAASAGRLGKREFVPLLVQKLADAHVRDDARSALERYGPAIAGTLADYLLDTGEAADVRREAARLLGQVASPESAAALLETLALEKEGVETDILDALDWIRSNKPDIPLPREAILAHFAADVEDAAGAKDPAALLHLFKLIGLIYDHDDVFRAYQNVLKGTKDSIAYAVELLDFAVDQEVKDKLFPLLERFGAEGKS
jgi:AAA family ATP:ADP antiporter